MIERTLWHVPALVHKAGDTKLEESDEYDKADDDRKMVADDTANAVSSWALPVGASLIPDLRECARFAFLGAHMPAIDMDFPLVETIDGGIDFGMNIGAEDLLDAFIECGFADEDAAGVYEDGRGFGPITAPFRIVESSTALHHHLYIDQPIRWWQYKELLYVMMSLELVEEGYYEVSMKRRMTFLRINHDKWDNLDMQKMTF